jgi:hypothetical protein
MLASLGDSRLLTEDVSKLADNRFGKINFRINDLKFIYAGIAVANGISACKFSSCSTLEIRGHPLAQQSWGAPFIITERRGISRIFSFTITTFPHAPSS